MVYYCYMDSLVGDILLEQYAGVISKEYDKSFQAIKRPIEQKLRSSSPERPLIHLGPEVKVSDRDRNVIFKTIILDDVVSEDSQSETIVFIGFDDLGKVVGHRFITISNSKYDAVAEAGGDAHLLQRGQGYLRFIEMATQDILLRCATQYGKSVRHTVGDNNESKLTNAELKLKSLSDSPEDQVRKPTLQEVHDGRLNEHGRWLSMWGPEGKLGYSPSENGFMQVRDFKPVDKAEYRQDLRSIGNIELTIEEVEQNGRMVIAPHLARQTQRKVVDYSADLQQIRQLIDA